MRHAQHIQDLANEAFEKYRGSNVNFWTLKDDDDEVILWKHIWCLGYESGIKDNLPEDCVAGYDEVKFCSIRNGDGWRCEHCAI
jgi:hypothetical protein